MERAACGVLSTSCAAVIGVVLSWAVPDAFAQTQRTDEILTVRGLVVVDERGVERVRIGAPLPDPIKEGTRVPRQGVVAGMLIFDADGDERGGYVTNARGDAFLTLDAKKGQQAIFIANRDNYASLRAVPTPLLEMVRDGKSAFRAGGPDAFSK